MTKPPTIVLQSHHSPLPHPWLIRCLNSVSHWSALHGYEYRFIGDELFQSIPRELLEKTADRKVIASDLGRLLELQKLLKAGYTTAIWFDADFLIFDPQNFLLPKDNYSVGREVWVQRDEQKLKAYRKVHNAFLMFRINNSFLDFYTDSAIRLLNLNNGSMPDQFIGPKLLTALHNIVKCPVMETAGMLSPEVILDIIQSGGDALALFLSKSNITPTAVNLCCSSINNKALTDQQMDQAIQILLQSGLKLQ